MHQNPMTPSNLSRRSPNRKKRVAAGQRNASGAVSLRFVDFICSFQMMSMNHPNKKPKQKIQRPLTSQISPVMFLDVLMA
jgi:hypothetical protein